MRSRISSRRREARSPRHARSNTVGQRLTMQQAIRQTLEDEMAHDPTILVFGEDVGAFGGVHRVTDGLQTRFGEARVFDTSLNEEGIIGRAVGMAVERPAPGAGNPVPQVRRPGARADHRRGQPALAHAWPLRRSHCAAHPRRLPTDGWRPLARGLRRGGLRPPAGLADRLPVHCARRRGAAAHGAARR